MGLIPTPEIKWIHFMINKERLWYILHCKYEILILNETYKHSEN